MGAQHPRTLLIGLALLGIASATQAQDVLSMYGSAPICNETVSIESDTLLGGVENCFVVSSLFPRQCACVSNTCGSTDSLASDSCNICNRGESGAGVQARRTGHATWGSPARHAVSDHVTAGQALCIPGC